MVCDQVFLVLLESQLVLLLRVKLDNFFLFNNFLVCGWFFLSSDFASNETFRLLFFFVRWLLKRLVLELLHECFLPILDVFIIIDKSLFFRSGVEGLSIITGQRWLYRTLN